MVYKRYGIYGTSETTKAITVRESSANAAARAPPFAI